MISPLPAKPLPILLTLLSIIFLTSPSVTAQTGYWSSHGPCGGHINCLTISASDPDILYAGTEDGIYKTTDGGDSWSRTGFPGFYEVISIKVHPSDPDLVMAGTLESGIYLSESGGVSWRYMGLYEHTINSLDADPNDPDVLYFGTGQALKGDGDWIAIYRITDGWKAGGPLISWDTWNECGWRMVTRVVADPDSSNWIYASGINSGYCPDFGGILISQDGGESWTDKKIGTSSSDQAANLAVLKNSQGERVLIAIYGGSPLMPETKLMKSPDLGDTWEEVDIPYAGEINPGILMVHPGDPGAVIIGSNSVDRPLWIYTEETGEWDYIAGTGLPPVISSSCAQVGAGEDSAWYMPTLYGGIYRSSGSEGRWEQINTGINNAVVNDFVVDPQDGTTLFAATEESLKLYKSPDGGDTWEIQTGNLSASFDVLAVDPNDPSTFWAAKNSSASGGYRLFKGEDYGRTWTGPIDFVNGTPASNRTEISDIVVKPGDPNRVLVSAQPWFLSTGLTGFGVVALTVDGGNTWNNFPVSGSCLTMDPADPDMIYVGKERSGQVFLIEIEGNTAILSNIEPEEGIEDVRDIASDNRSNLFVATEDGLWRKDAAGWVRLDCPEDNIAALAMDHSRDPSVIYAGSESGGILVSGDSGESWMTFNDGLGNLNITKLQVGNQVLYASTATGGVWSRSIPQNLAPPFLTHHTGHMKISVFQNGSIGHAAPNWTYGEGLVFSDNIDPLFSGGLILGTSETGMVNGQLGSFGINSDFQNTSPISGFESIPGKWDQVAVCAFNDLSSPFPLGIRVVQRSYSDTGEDLLILRYNLESETGSLDGLYAGLYADWDVGGGDHHDRNLGGFDLSRNLAYQYLDGGDPDPNYYGFVALEGVSGMRITGKGNHLYIRDSSLRWISTMNDAEITEPEELRMWIGSGPFTLGEDESLQVCFAVVTGASLEELQANADLAAERYLQLQDVTQVETGFAPGFSLGQNLPNPFTGECEIGYTVPEECEVRIEVHNSQGVLVRIIEERPGQPGDHSVRINAEGLDPGIYFYSMKCPGFSQTRMMVVY